MQRNGGISMREIKVTYLLSDNQVERLTRITEEYRKQSLNLTLDKQFEGIMIYGADEDINRRFTMHEQLLGITEQ